MCLTILVLASLDCPVLILTSQPALAFEIMDDASKRVREHIWQQFLPKALDKGLETVPGGLDKLRAGISAKKTHCPDTELLTSSLICTKHALITIHVFVSEVAANPSLYIIAVQISNSPSSNVTTMARVAVSKMSSTPSQVREEHSGYFQAPISSEIDAASVVAMNFRDFFCISSIANGSSRNFSLAQQV